MEWGLAVGAPQAAQHRTCRSELQAAPRCRRRNRRALGPLRKTCRSGLPRDYRGHTTDRAPFPPVSVSRGNAMVREIGSDVKQGSGCRDSFTWACTLSPLSVPRATCSLRYRPSPRWGSGSVHPRASLVDRRSNSISHWRGERRQLAISRVNFVPELT